MRPDGIFLSNGPGDPAATGKYAIEIIENLIKENQILSDEISTSIFENVYTDGERLFEPRAVFNDKTLLSHITKKFPSGFRDYKLEDKVIKYWIEKNLPTTGLTLDTNVTKLSADFISQMKLKPDIITKIENFELKGSKLRKKRLY